MTAAYTTLQTNLTRAGYFLDLHEQWQEGAGAPENRRRELPRGAVVFAVGAFDTFLADVVAEVLIQRARAGLVGAASRDLMRKINSAAPGLALELILENDHETAAFRLQEAIVNELQTTSWFGADAVGKAVGLLDGSTRAIWESAEAEGLERPAQLLNDWTDRRHRIVHRGERVRVWRSHARDCIELLTVLGEAIDAQAQAALDA